MSEINDSRRQFVLKVAYTVPFIATMSVMPSLASAGSVKSAGQNCNNGVGNGSDCLPPGLQKNGKTFLDNDDNGGTPGNPESKGGNGG